MYFIYKICCKNETITDCYIGQTINFKKRIYEHKKSCYNENRRCFNYPVYVFIRENGGWDNFKIEIIEQIECDNKLNAYEKEYYWCNQFNATLNKQRPGQGTGKQWREKNKDYQKAWKEKNKDYQKAWKEKNKDYHKEYYKAWKEKNKDYHKEYCKKLI
jgi:group I intron endonuclease